MDRVVVHPRVGERHPDVSRDDVELAWRNARAMRHRNFDPPAYIAAAGADTHGRLIEMLGVELEGGGVLVYHAQKLTRKMARELGLDERGLR